MSGELEVKSATKGIAKKLVAIRLPNDVVFFGINGSQISTGMTGIHLELRSGWVIVTSDSYKGEERWIQPTGCTLTWKEPSE